MGSDGDFNVAMGFNIRIFVSQVCIDRIASGVSVALGLPGA